MKNTKTMNKLIEKNK